MPRLFLRLAIVVVLLFSSVIGIIHAQPFDDTAMQTLLSTSADCSLPCFMGIRLGVTTPVEAARLLRAHPWVGSVTVVNERTSAPVQAIYFEWSGQQPAIFRSGSQSEILLSSGNRQVVERITLYTTIPVGYAFLKLGATDDLDSGNVTNRSEAAFLSAVYLKNGIRLWTLVNCPVTRSAFWNSPMAIEFNSTISLYRLFGGLYGFC